MHQNTINIMNKYNTDLPIQIPIPIQMKSFFNKRDLLFISKLNKEIEYFNNLSDEIKIGIIENDKKNDNEILNFIFLIPINFDGGIIKEIYKKRKDINYIIFKEYFNEFDKLRGRYLIHIRATLIDFWGKFLFLRDAEYELKKKIILSIIRIHNLIFPDCLIRESLNSYHELSHTTIIEL